MKTLFKIIIIAIILCIPLLLLIISNKTNTITAQKTDKLMPQESSYEKDNLKCEEDDSNSKCNKNEQPAHKSNDLELLTSDNKEYLQ